ncbi:MAG: hypothetical protein U0984_03695 [Prosthecobacter sp.]|nr:hypothetical protein [Prosthecobacter sp.]
MIRKLLRRALPRLHLPLAGAVSASEILLSKLGYWRSVKDGKPVGRSGEPLPWFTYPALAWLDMLDLSKARVFEYGSGWGTLHWAQRAAEVTAVEEKPEWAAKIRPLLPGNAQLIGPVSGQDYIEAARTGAPWDVVIVDGILRRECAEVAAQVVRPAGLILLDNADWFVEAAAVLRGQGLTQVDFQGFGPCNAYTWTTSAFIGKHLDLPRLSQPWSRIDRGAIPYQL